MNIQPGLYQINDRDKFKIDRGFTEQCYFQLSPGGIFPQFPPEKHPKYKKNI